MNFWRKKIETPVEIEKPKPQIEGTAHETTPSTERSDAKGTAGSKTAG